MAQKELKKQAVRTGRVGDSTLAFAITCEKDSTQMLNQGHGVFTCDKCGSSVSVEFW